MSDSGDERERDQRPADGVRRSRVGEEREGRAFVGPVSNAQDSGDNRDRSAEGDVGGDPGLGAAVGDDDQRGDQKKPEKSAVLGPVCQPVHWLASTIGSTLWGGSMPISRRADWQRVQTFSQLP